MDGTPAPQQQQQFPNVGEDWADADVGGDGVGFGVGFGVGGDGGGMCGGGEGWADADVGGDGGGMCGDGCGVGTGPVVVGGGGRMGRSSPQGIRHFAATATATAATVVAARATFAGFGVRQGQSPAQTVLTRHREWLAHAKQLEKEVEELRNREQQAAQALEKARAETQQYALVNEQLQGALTTAKNDCDGARQDADAQGAAAHEAQIALAQQKGQIATLTKQADEAKAKEAGANKNALALKTRLNVAATEKEAAEQELDELKKALDETCNKGGGGGGGGGGPGLVNRVLTQASNYQDCPVQDVVLAGESQFQQIQIALQAAEWAFAQLAQLNDDMQGLVREVEPLNSHLKASQHDGGGRGGTRRTGGSSGRK